MRPQARKYLILALFFLAWGYFSTAAEAAAVPEAVALTASRPR